ncbi:SDR family oxidoreductase [Phyllobacterium myrsinacearum]|jgi:NAD(P)-dependent dehydrogenase (short-subunit alcohol dehydrogenase family)|uniref:Short-chain dehydrogenase n=1 Tax=Phyllobacterium myrsinacearum TaxID=28101 RepID=A0A2S9JAP8_9HYPH|nr:SDR family oxidoreductase [Phyllobacterium myrsinacearum]PRD49829.1 short-chain dehydrogenase [Phyllobacterium myrsinacearum]PWV83957.1 NAD(P)-dependent dehydrogenase (short-subunit alcohol dehydrogenase family) [Phyllobacterium myrsinacearum]RZS76803.1 NAD(P)-dependent dehydrogenase (short-subunit alcohol dehydrogenase family) [Phyllobacterium myrsinacearum]RZU96977.1 NAD(P)-dependent dehydrogenase (short-subunit alcohol dehydrogenase family) [Phyllobacterium myrsinacearum]
MKEERVALVTGGNKGIGLEVSRQLGMAGVRVVIGARNVDRGTAAAAELKSEGIDAFSVQLDVTNEQSITAAAQVIADSHGRLDILVNNAGIFDFADAPPSRAAIDAVRTVVEVNFIGALAVTQAVLPLLRTSPAGRIVNVSSSLGSLTLNGDPTSTYYSQQFIGYNASKASLNMLTIQLHQELKETGIVVNSVSPGFVKTDLTGYGNMTPEEGARLPVQYALIATASGTFVEPGNATPW